MQLTKKEQTEVNQFAKKHPTITKIFTILEKRIDDMEKDMDAERSKLKEEVSKNNNR